MRGAAAFALAFSASLLVLGPASAQRATTGSAPPLVSPAPALAPAPGLAPAAAAPAPSIAKPPGAPALAPANAPAAKISTKCENPNALGVSRTVEIDTTGGPGFG